MGREVDGLPRSDLRIPTPPVGRPDAGYRVKAATTYRIETTDPLVHERSLRGLDALLALFVIREHAHEVARGKREGTVASIYRTIVAELEERGIDLDRLLT